MNKDDDGHNGKKLVDADYRKKEEEEEAAECTGVDDNHRIMVRPDDEAKAQVVVHPPTEQHTSVATTTYNQSSCKTMKESNDKEVTVEEKNESEENRRSNGRNKRKKKHGSHHHRGHGRTSCSATTTRHDRRKGARNVKRSDRHQGRHHSNSRNRHNHSETKSRQRCHKDKKKGLHRSTESSPKSCSTMDKAVATATTVVAAHPLDNKFCLPQLLVSDEEAISTEPVTVMADDHGQDAEDCHGADGVASFLRTTSRQEERAPSLEEEEQPRPPPRDSRSKSVVAVPATIGTTTTTAKNKEEDDDVLRKHEIYKETKDNVSINRNVASQSQDDEDDVAVDNHIRKSIQTSSLERYLALSSLPPAQDYFIHCYHQHRRVGNNSVEEDGTSAPLSIIPEGMADVSWRKEKDSVVSHVIDDDDFPCDCHSQYAPSDASTAVHCNGRLATAMSSSERIIVDDEDYSKRAAAMQEKEQQQQHDEDRPSLPSTVHVVTDSVREYKDDVNSIHGRLSIPIGHEDGIVASESIASPYFHPNHTSLVPPVPVHMTMEHDHDVERPRMAVLSERVNDDDDYSSPSWGWSKHRSRLLALTVFLIVLMGTAILVSVPLTSHDDSESSNPDDSNVVVEVTRPTDTVVDVSPVPSRMPAVPP